METMRTDRYRPILGRLGQWGLLIAACLVVPFFYRLKVRKGELPEGPALYAPNHVTWIDAILLSVALRRPIRFVMTARLYDNLFIGPFVRLAGVIPIRPRSEDPECLDRAYEAIEAALAAGEQVCIFPEGRLTPSGEIAEFRNGVLRIVSRQPVPVVPVGLGGLWGSRWSHEGSRWSWRRRSVDINSGELIAPRQLRADALRERVVGLRTAA